MENKNKEIEIDTVDLLTIRQHLEEIDHIARKHNLTPFGLIEKINNAEKVKIS